MKTNYLQLAAGCLLLTFAACQSAMNTAELDANKQAFRDFLAAIDESKGIPASFLTEDAKIHYGGMPEMDVAGYQEMGNMMYAAFPNLKHEVVEILAEGDMIAARVKVWGTHNGPFQGMPATGNSIEFMVNSIAHYKDGKAYDICSEFNLAHLMAQVSPPMEAPTGTTAEEGSM